MNNNLTKSIFASSLIIFFLTIISRVLGFIRELLIASFYGTSAEADAFYLAFAIPEMLDKFLITGALGSLLVPTFTKFIVAKDDKGLREFYFSFRNILLFLTLIISSLIAVFANEVIMLLSPNLDSQSKELTIPLLRIMIFANVFLGLTALTKSYLNSKKVFLISAFAPVIQNILFIFIVLFTVKYLDLYSLAIAYLISVILQYLFQAYFVKLKGRLNFSVKLSNSIITLTKLSIPAMFTLLFTEVNLFVDKIASSNIQVGGVSSLTYANKIIQLPIGILGGSLITVFIPHIANFIQQNKENEVKKYINILFKSTAIFSFPITVFLFLYSEETIRFIFGYGNFNSNSIILTSSVLNYYSITIFFYIGIIILIRVFHNYLNVKTPMFLGMIVLIFKLITTFFFLKNIGFFGVLLSTLLSTIFGFIILLIALLTKMKVQISLKELFYWGKLITGNIIFAFSLIILEHYLIKITSIFGLALFSIIGFLIYICILYALKLEDFKQLFSRIRKNERG